MRPPEGRPLLVIIKYMYAKKSLGQNFLHNTTILKNIIEAGEVTQNDFVIEIGPGRGALTTYLLDTGAKVLAFEKDIDMVTVLTEKFNDEIAQGRFEIFHKDILQTDISSVVPPNATYKVIANIPYYITGAILEHVFSSPKTPTLVAYMVQKEVAERIARNKNKESILSISVKAYGVPEYIKTVASGNFSPAPNVDSAILRVSDVSQELFNKHKITPKDFFKVLTTGMGQKRKTLVNNLKSIISQEKIHNYLQSKNYPETVRPEDITVVDWAELTKLL